MAGTQSEAVRLAALQELRLLDTPSSESFDRITRMASQLFGLLRIPTKPAGDSDLKPAVVPRRSRPPFRSEAGRWRRRSRGSEVKITGSVQQVKR